MTTLPAQAAPAKRRATTALSSLARAKPVRRALGQSGALSMLHLLLTAAAWVIAARFISAAFLGEGWPAAGTPALLTLGGLLLARAGLGAWREYLGAQLAARMVSAHRLALGQKCLKLGPAAVTRLGEAELTTLSSELERLGPYYARYLPGAVHAGLAFAVVLLCTWLLDHATAALLLITGPITVIFLALVGLATQAATEAQWLQHTRLSARLLSVARELPTLHAYGVVQPYRELLGESARQHRLSTLKVLKIAFLSGFVMDFAATLATALIAVWIGVRLFGGEAQLAPTLAALMLVPEFFGPLRQLGSERHAALDAEPVAGRLSEVLALHDAPQGQQEVLGVPTLSLRKARAVAGDATGPTLTAELRPGARYTLHGHSGSGKTTLLQALRKHLPYSGEVHVSGVALNDLATERWQRQVAYVPQHPRLIAASVLDNVRLSAPQASRDQVWEALRATQLAATVQQLPEGLNTLLGEGGVRLSGGETARLALARTLLSGAGVVLLDEVSAHLDPESEQQLYQVLTCGFAGRTLLLATHRAAPAGWTPLHLEGSA